MRALGALILLLAVAPACAAEPQPFQDWAVAVIAADWRSSDGKPIDAFDNARRDVGAAYVAAGFAPQNLRQYSLRPPRPGDDPSVVVADGTVFDGVKAVAAQATGGCLVHLTSHGEPSGIVFGPDRRLSPRGLDRLLDDACGARPTVVVVSACYSGVFVPALAAPNRMVLTAARPDRSSFGCGENDRYPFFDQCVIENLPEARDFLDLGRRARTCVWRLETEQKLKPPSEPQVFVGSEMQVLLPLAPFRRAAPAG